MTQYWRKMSHGQALHPWEPGWRARMAWRFGGSNPRSLNEEAMREPDRHHMRTTDEPNTHRTRTTGAPGRHRARTRHMLAMELVQMEGEVHFEI